MNRIALEPSETFTNIAPLETHQSNEWLTRIRRFPDPQTTNVPFATFAPMHYEERYAYPLLVWLHGDGGNEQELRQIMPLVSMRNYVAIAPRGTQPWQRNRGRCNWQQSPDAIETAQSRISECIATAQRRFNIHPQRIFLAGRESGGTMAFRAAWNDPNRFAGVASLHAPLPSELSPLRRVNELRKLPCLLATSENSALYPQKRVCEDLRLLHTAGCCKVMLRHYPGDDGLTNVMLSDLNKWLMELVCGAACAR